MSNSPELGSWVGSLEPLSKQDNLCYPFESSVTAKQDFSVGIEIEQFLVNPLNFRALPYFGEKSISAVLLELHQKYRWQPILEQNHIIGLKQEGLSITLEPGGAFEFVCSPYKTVHQIDQAISSFEKDLTIVLSELGIACLPLGYLPFDDLRSINLVPKSRYDFMYSYMPKVGSRGREMMKLTSSIQVAIDYQSELDAIRKSRLAALASPIFIALSANSLIKQGQVGKFASERTDVWAYTDQNRSGIPAFQLSQSSSFSDYVDWALQAPVYFVLRGEEKVVLENISFAEYLEQGFRFPDAAEQPYPIKADWEQHLSTMFPWVRLRHYIEIRSFDSGPAPAQRAAAALVKGLFYCEESLSQFEQLVGNFDQSILQSLLEQATLSGLDGEAKGIKLRDLCTKTVEIAETCLKRCGKGEDKYLAWHQERCAKWNLKQEHQQIEEDIIAYLTEKLF